MTTMSSLSERRPYECDPTHQRRQRAVCALVDPVEPTIMLPLFCSSPSASTHQPPSPFSRHRQMLRDGATRRPKRPTQLHDEFPTALDLIFAAAGCRAGRDWCTRPAEVTCPQRHYNQGVACGKSCVRRQLTLPMPGAMLCVRLLGAACSRATVGQEWCRRRWLTRLSCVAQALERPVGMTRGPRR